MVNWLVVIYTVTFFDRSAGGKKVHGGDEASHSENQLDAMLGSKAPKFSGRTILGEDCDNVQLLPHLW